MKNGVKDQITFTKIRQEWSDHYKGNKKLFWKEVNGVRKNKESVEVNLKDANWTILVEEEKEVQRRWTEYFEQLLNIDERKEAEISTLGMEGRGSRRVLDFNRIKSE